MGHSVKHGTSQQNRHLLSQVHACALSICSHIWVGQRPSKRNIYQMLHRPQSRQTFRSSQLTPKLKQMVQPATGLRSFTPAIAPASNTPQGTPLIRTPDRRSRKTVGAASSVAKEPPELELRRPAQVCRGMLPSALSTLPI